MTSIPRPAPKRKPAGERRAEIVAAASRIALDEGLESVTLARVAEALGVVPGLVSHYFRAVDELVATAFSDAAAGEREEVFAAVEKLPDDPTARMRGLLDLLAGEDRDEVSLLWLDAWQAGRRRAGLREEVARQMAAWRGRLAALIQEGVVSGDFRTDDAAVASARILTMIDGLSVQAALRATEIDYTGVREIVLGTAERELGLPQGLLHPEG